MSEISAVRITRLSYQFNLQNHIVPRLRAAEGSARGKCHRRVRGRDAGTLSEDRGSHDGHVTSAIMSETEIMSVIMAVIALVQPLRWR